MISLGITVASDNIWRIHGDWLLSHPELPSIKNVQSSREIAGTWCSKNYFWDDSDFPINIWQDFLLGYLALNKFLKLKMIPHLYSFLCHEWVALKIEKILSNFLQIFLSKIILDYLNIYGCCKEFDKNLSYWLE